MNPFEHSLSRYLTQPELDKIRSMKIGVAGAGGLGSNICNALIRTGFRSLEIIDKDVVEASNLNRQCYSLSDIGQPKVNCLKRQLLAINPDARIDVYHQEWSVGNANNFFNHADILIEAFDGAGIKARLVEHYTQQGPLIVSGNGMAAADITQAPVSIKKIGNIYLVGDGVSSTDDGRPPLAPRVLQCSARMTEVVLNLTLGKI